MRTIVITGSSRRLGLFLVEKFLSMGDTVIAITRSPSQNFQSISSEHLQLIQIDSYDQFGITKAMQEIETLAERVDLLINNASMYDVDPENFEELENHYLSLFNVHMLFPTLLITALKEHMYSESTPGVVVNITDIYADNPNPEYALYCSTKSGLESLTQSFAKKFSPGIRCNSIMPGPIQFLEQHTEHQKSEVYKETLLPFEGGYMPVFQAVTFLLDNHYVTGTSIKVDGGRSICRG
ncbi:short chain dehydrogenase/reductase family protein [Shewanella sediminis HAW-EB3]|uniref:Short chain dehydrogenase/reductase family protein n=1 Tax=Shewanella sediminis (strain HAW-EB3) TaxID=425104 RepID=A8G154_SHESH|nr:SDR family NAD(P)-dependent oxidoreductase [Shewanella sediminis]ABV38827.1 short chain dehydrogenase/reductase family protein [Shewanella sediminis HAW-EB3]